MLWSRELSKASVSQEILEALGKRSDVPPFRILPSEHLDFLIVSETTVVGVEIALGTPDSSLPYTSLGRLERASYLLPAQFPAHALNLALLTNLELPARTRRVLTELGVRLFHVPNLRSDPAAVANLMMTG